MDNEICHFRRATQRLIGHSTLLLVMNLLLICNFQILQALAGKKVHGVRVYTSGEAGRLTVARVPDGHGREERMSWSHAGRVRLSLEYARHVVGGYGLDG